MTAISIHALLAESDRLNSKTQIFPLKFLSTLSLRRATGGAVPDESILEFLSTLSLRRATPVGRQHRPARPDFYPRSPCGERRS